VAPVADPLEHQAERASQDAPNGRGDVRSVQPTPARPSAGPPAPDHVHRVLQTPGHGLDAQTRQRAERRFGRNFSHVRIHADELAAQSAAGLRANAYTADRHLVFARGAYAPATLHGNALLTHELVHVVQQSGGATAVQRQTEGGRATQSAAADQVIEALTRRDEIAGVGDAGAALAILRGLAADERVAALITVDDHALLDVLISALAPGDQSEVASVIYAVRFTSPRGTPTDQFAVQAARGLAQLPEATQDLVLSAVLARRGSTVSVQQMREGIAALVESEDALDAESNATTEDADPPTLAPLMAGIAIGPWNPGGMPIPFYIGNAAHVGIAASYAALHATDAAFYNFSPIASILQAASALGIAVSPAALTATQLGLKPDIANLSRRHLYEIKPDRLQSLGRAEALLYAAAFALGGLPIALGPVSEPGTAGTIAAPGGWYIYSAPEPGVITYRYRQPKRRRQTAPAPAPVAAPDPSLVKRISVATGLTGTALVVYLVISEGSRVFPPRNLIPVP
jgi:hypothetical protein